VYDRLVQPPEADDDALVVTEASDAPSGRS
jgi:hypothetical protein